ncbi:MAG: PEP-CTERM sorting domain-containing protein [Fimbriimonadaceae bacterium]
MEEAPAAEKSRWRRPLRSVPEPSTMALLALGGVAALRKKFKK